MSRASDAMGAEHVVDLARDRPARSYSSGVGARMNLYRGERRLWSALHPYCRFGVIDSLYAYTVSGVAGWNISGTSDRPSSLRLRVDARPARAPSGTHRRD